MAGIDDVARAAGVSTATVSRALSGRGPVSTATRDRVLAAADRLGYVVSAAASSLATGRTRAVGVVVPFLDRWFFSTVLAGISDALVRRGYDITLYSVSADAAERRRVFDDHLRRRRIDAVITIALELDAEELASLRGLGVPTRKGKVGRFAVKVPGHVIDVVAVHVHAELGSANAERVDLTKREELRGLCDNAGL